MKARAKLLEERRSNFDNFLEERMPVLVDFFQSLGFEDAYLVLLEIEGFVPPFSDYLEKQLIDADDKIWITTRVGYFIGEWFVQVKGGHWKLDENPLSGTYTNYCIEVEGKTIDPFQLAHKYINEPIGRRLEHFLG